MCYRVVLSSVQCEVGAPSDGRTTRWWRGTRRTETEEPSVSPALACVSPSDALAPTGAPGAPDVGSRSPDESTGGEPTVRRNRILSALPDEALRRLLPELTTVSLDVGQVLYEPGEPIDHVYFPINAVISVISVLRDGSTVEVATVGNEGMAGIAAFLGAASTPHRSLSQVSGTAARLPVPALRDLTGGTGPLDDRLRHYTQALLNQVAQTAACNRMHSIEERCARWLLMMHDRVQVDRFYLTQHFLAQMLGVRRATVTVAAGRLQQLRLIRYSRGKIVILDRAGLERTSCECYAVVRGQFDGSEPL